MLAKAVLLQLAGSKNLEKLVRGNQLSSKAARRFIAGEGVEEAIAAVKDLNSSGITASLDLLGESVRNAQEVSVVVDTYLKVFEHILKNRLDANVSIKLTALGIDIDAEQCYRNIAHLLSSAPTPNPNDPLNAPLFVRIDMESATHTQATLDLFYRLRSEGFANTGVVIQSYLRRSEADIDRLVSDKVRVRLCKGAYKEPDSLAFPDKSDVDANYVSLMKKLMLEGNYPGLATHDEAIIDEAKRWAKEKNIASDRYEFQMLFGIRRDLQTQLVKEGYRVRCYTPFGDHWYPYLMRRLAERPANVMFILKNLLKP